MRNKPRDLEPHRSHPERSYPPPQKNHKIPPVSIVKSLSNDLAFYGCRKAELQNRVKAVGEGLRQRSGAEHRLAQRPLRWSVGRSGGLARRAKENVKAQRSVFSKRCRKHAGLCCTAAIRADHEAKSIHADAIFWATRGQQIKLLAQCWQAIRSNTSGSLSRVPLVVFSSSHNSSLDDGKIS